MWRIPLPGSQRRDEISHARRALRLILARYTGTEPAALPIVIAPGGKPMLEAGSVHEWLRFNLSHTRGLALVAIAQGREVGVDVEHISEARAAMTIAEQLFAPSEVTLLRSCPEPSRRPTFFRFWTRKEAYVKALGTGVTVPLHEVEVLNGSPDAGWTLHDLDVGPDYAAALAVERAVSSIRTFESPG